MTTWKFWRDAIERAVKTFAQSLIALITAVQGFSLFSADWPDMLATAGAATLLSVLASVASAQTGEPLSASLLKDQ